MQDDYGETERDGFDDGLDASSLAGIGQYSATGGGSQPLHDPRGRGAAAEDEPDGDSLGELYRYSLRRATQDEAVSPSDPWVDGPLHLEDPRR